MGKHIAVSLAVVVASALATSAFASSGYGPDPAYNPLVGAPVSQRGMSAQSIKSDSQQAAMARSYGEDSTGRSEAGSRSDSNPAQLFSHR